MSFLDGRFRLGANFWSRHAGPRTWSRVDDAALAAELTQARSIGLDLLRVFAFVPDFVVDGTIAPAMLARLRAFADLAQARDLALLASPLVGHMSGENFDLPGGDLFEDPAVVDLAAALVDGVAGAIGEHPALAGWALTNEAPLWAGVHEGKRPAAASVLAWVDRMIAAARARSSRPIGLGDGQMAGFPNAAIATRVDFTGPHVYYGDSDPLRQALRFDHALALAERYGRPVLLEEFGGSSSQVGEPEQAALWNEAIFAAFSRGARGALGWCWSDFPVETVGREIPYEHHGFELGFGLTRADGSEKPVCSVLRAWRAFLDGLPEASPRPAPQAAIVRSSFLERDYPFSWFDRGAADRAELTTLVLATQAALSPLVCDEERLADTPLLIVPSTQRLLTSTWLALEERARAGATVYWSYFGGDHLFHQGSWCPIFERLTGCRHRLRYGCFDLPEDHLRLDGALADLPPLPTGADQARGAVPDRAPALAYLPIEPGPATHVLACDDRGRPILVEQPIGKGRVLFCAAPIERYAAQRHDGGARGLVALYRVLAARAGLADPLGLRTGPAADAERLTVAPVEVGATRLCLVMNRSWTPARLPQSLRGQPRWCSSPMGPIEPLLPPKAVIAIDLR